MKEILLNICEFTGLSILRFTAWFWEDKEFDDAANGLIEDMLKQK